MKMNKIDLFYAIRWNRYDLFINGIEYCIDINEINKSKQNLLHISIISGNPSVFDILMNKGIFLDQQDENGQTPLHYSATPEKIEFARRIINAGGRLDVSDFYGNEPLWTAVFNARGNPEIVELFVKNGANPNHENNNGLSPFCFAKKIGNRKLIDILSVKG